MAVSNYLKTGHLKMISSPAINSLFTKLHQSDKNENKSVKRNQFKSQRECEGPLKAKCFLKH